MDTDEHLHWIWLSGISSIADVFIFIGKYTDNEMNIELYNDNKK